MGQNVGDTLWSIIWLLLLLSFFVPDIWSTQNQPYIICGVVVLLVVNCLCQKNSEKSRDKYVELG